MLRPILLLRLPVQRPASMLSIAMDITDTPPSKVKKLNNSTPESHKPESNQTDKLKRKTQVTFKWLRKSVMKNAASRQAGADRTSARKASVGQVGTTGKVELSAGYNQAAAVQAPEPSATLKTKPLHWVAVVQNGMSSIVPKFHSTGFISSFNAAQSTQPFAMLQASHHTANSGLETELRTSHHTTNSGTELRTSHHTTNPGTELRTSHHSTNPGTELRTSHHATNPGTELRTSHHTTNSGTELRTSHHATNPGTELRTSHHATNPGTELRTSHHATNPGTELRTSHHATNSGTELRASHHTTNPRTELRTSHHATNSRLRIESNTQYHTTNVNSDTNLQANYNVTNVPASTDWQANSTIHSSTFPSLAAAQRYSQMDRVPYWQPVIPYPANFQAGSFSRIQTAFFEDRPSQTAGCYGSQILRNYSSWSSSEGVHLSARGQVCPELTRTPRRWHTIQQSSAEAGSLEFSVMTYNILSQELLVRHTHLYTKCTESDLEWANRGPALLTQIIAHNADIICLQEVQEDHWNHDIKASLVQQGYQGVYKKPDGEKPDGCAILFKASKFKQLKFVPVQFMKGGILDRSNMGIILLLQPRPEVYGGSVKKICLATTHLLFNPKRGDVKLAQLALFLAEIDKHAYQQDDPSGSKLSTPSNDSTLHAGGSSNHVKQPQVSDGVDISESLTRKEEDSHSRNLYCPIILCGDFNSEPFSDFYKFITTGNLRYDHLVARLLCGQKEGQEWGTDRKVGKFLLPDDLSISETCQYVKVLNKRHVKAGTVSHHLKVNSGKFFHCMNFKSVYSHCANLSGWLVKEVTTQHNSCSCTVDYIFYSRQQQQVSPGFDSQVSVADQRLDGSPPGSQGQTRSTEAGSNETDTIKQPLELLARYSLLTSKEMARYGSLPNSTFPSDHLCLIARFLLR